MASHDTSKGLEEDAQPTQYPQTKLNSIRVYKDRGHYDYATVHGILDSTYVSHVAWIATDENGEAYPVNLPLGAVLGQYDPSMGDYESVDDVQLEAERQEAMSLRPLNIYLHCNVASQLYKTIKASHSGNLRVCVTSTRGRFESMFLERAWTPELEPRVFLSDADQVDGLVLFFTPNGHSLNYRSATVHGVASLLPSSPQNPADMAKKRWAMRLFTNHIIRSRWTTTHPVSPASIQAVQVVEVQILSASAKVRAANIGTFDVGSMKLDIMGPREAKSPTSPDLPRPLNQEVWTGVLPLYEVLGQPVASGVRIDNRHLLSVVPDDGITSPLRERLEKWRHELNELAKVYAVEAAQPGRDEKEMGRKVAESLDWSSTHA